VDQAEDARHIDQRVTTIGQDFAAWFATDEREPALAEALIRWTAINTIPQGRPRRVRHPAATTHLQPPQVDLLEHTLSPEREDGLRT
jgi:hypothetical protein